MTASAEWKTGGRLPTFSFYFTAHACKTKPHEAIAAAELADGITIAGPKGPGVARRLRDTGLEAPLLFDGAGYKFENVPGPERWIQLQALADAAQYLLPGAFIRWDRDSDAAFVDIVKEQGRVAADLGAMMLLAVDVRWVARRMEMIVDALQSTGQAVALVLAHRADPLSEGGAVEGLRQVASNIERLFQFRNDHGSIGGVAFGAEHASFGLTTSTRHFATVEMRPRRRPGTSERLFVPSLLDWFLAHDVAGWTAAGIDVNCHLPCCGGNSLSRFLDPELDAKWHNMNALADLARHIFALEPSDRRIEFLRICREAVSQYDLAGLQGPEDPKPQLTSWVFS